MTHAWQRWDGGDLVLQVRIRPRAGADKVIGVEAERLIVSVRALPIDGRANDALRALLAAEFRVPKAQVEIVSGALGRQKALCIRSPRSLPSWLGG